jgi:hypothetical protein
MFEWRRRLVVASVLAGLAAACGGSSATAPSSASASSSTSTACPLTNGKVPVVITYARDRSKISAPQLFQAPSLVLVDFGDNAGPADPAMTKIDDYTWTKTVFVVPNVDPMSHGAVVVDLALLQLPANIANSLNPYAVTGVTANGIQVRKITFDGRDLGYFGVDACGRIFV